MEDVHPHFPETQADAPQFPSPEASVKKRIMVVDDDAAIRELIGTCLDKLGYEVILCESGHQCLRQVILKKPDAIVLDIRLPDMDGSNVLDCIRVTKLAFNVPIIMMSGNVELAAGSKLLELGALGFLPKPFPPDALATVLAEHLGAVSKTVA